MATANTVSTLTGLFKERYAPRLERLRPEEFKFQNAVNFEKRRRLGNIFHQPVVLKGEHGATYAASGDGAFQLDNPVAGQIEDAQVQGSQFVLRGAIDFESLAKGSNGEEASFEDSNSLLLENMMMTAKQRLEISLLYGQDELGTVASAGASDFVITTAEWAPGIWSGMEGARLEIFDSAGTIQRPGIATITAVDIVTRTITVDTLPTGTTGTDRVFFKTEHTTSAEKNMAGIHKILTNTGVLFNISATTYSLWKANSVANGGGNLTFETAQDAVAISMGKGFKGDATLFINVSTWAKLMTDQAALRQYIDPNRSGNYEVGAEKMTFYSQAGKLTIEASIMVKEGYAYLLQPEKNWTRIGATDITFKVPGRGGDLYRQMDGAAGIEIQCYYHQAIFSKMPGRACLITGIVNS